MPGISIIFFLKAVLFGLAAIVTIPKEQYKKFLMYGFVFGGIGDTLIVFFLSRVFHLIEYLNMGPFAFLGFYSFWTPLAWTFALMVFFYFLPTWRPFLYLYILGFTFLAYGVGQILEGFGVFRYIGIQKYLAPGIFLVWFSAASWFYMRKESIRVT